VTSTQSPQPNPQPTGRKTSAGQAAGQSTGPKIRPVSAEQQPGEPLIEIRNLDLWYQNVQALFNVSMDILPESVTAIIGPSGCGKSTLLRCINRMNDRIPHCRIDGSLKLEGQDVYGKNVDPVAVRRHIGMVFQKPNPFPKTIFENVAYGLRIRPRHKDLDIEQRVEWALKRAFLWEEVKDKLFDASGLSISGGQQQRLCIARALAVKPEVLLMDEPCSALDPLSTAKIEELIHDLKKEYAIVIVTHNMQQAARVGDFTAFMHLGKLIEYDTSEVIFGKPAQELTENYVTGRFG
jgi:phosphate transport system ATP-binding protein